MKILLTTDTYENQVCGVSSSIATLKGELINQGHDVKVLLMSRNHKSKIIKDNYLIGSFSFPFIDFRQSFRYNDKVLDEIISWNPDIIHVQTEWYAGRVGKKLAEKCNIPYINTSHTLWEEFTKGLIPIESIRKFFSKNLVKSSYANSSAIVVPSEKMISFLKKIHITLPIHIIPTGVDISNFNRDFSSFEKNKLKSQININENSKVLISIGRISKEKNLDELIDFLPDLILKNKDIVLIIGGDGPHLKHLKNKVEKLNVGHYVRFVGLIPPKDTYKYYNIADIFVSASTCETQGITYMEALASSLPLVCRYDESLDNVIDNGINGFTYRNKEEFIKYIIKILNMDGDYAKLKNNAFKSSLKFSKEKFGKDMEKVYLDYINKFHGKIMSGEYNGDFGK